MLHVMQMFTAHFIILKLDGCNELNKDKRYYLKNFISYRLLTQLFFTKFVELVFHIFGYRICYFFLQ